MAHTDHHHDPTSPDALLALLDAAGDDDPADHPSDEDDHHGDVLDLFDPRVFGYSQNDVVVGLVAPEEDSELAPDSAEELSHAAQRCLSDARKGTRKKAELVSFSEDDFEGAQRDAFIIIKQHKNWLFGASAKPADQWRAIDWFFTIEDDGKEATFDLCCRAFGARIEVVRLRIQYEFFLRWFVSPVDFPFLTVPVPAIIDSEIAYVTGVEGQRLASIAWNKPGITTAELLHRAGDGSDVKRALEILEDRLILCSQSEGFWYLTGRNPYLLRKRLGEAKGNLLANLGGSIHWSKLL